jgi:hypothetical protein
VAALTLSCGVAPVKREASPPARHRFAGAHGQPLAYGGRVCALNSAHTHSYPPVPAAAFLDCPEGARETRPLYAYWGEHARAGGQGRCFLERFHLHLEAPGEGLRWDERHGAYVEDDLVAGGRRSGRCAAEPCAHHQGATGCDAGPES